ncbi:MAG: ribbon-helix-helix protein, CopG family [Candidatus Aminicenantes bacterium]|nr:ribbon-helix-helix protein, CopG family [Candidatus Aminicenantes bacterium]
MAKTLKFSISMSAPEFKTLEKARRRAGTTRSQFVREAVGAFGSVKEDRSTYGSPCPADLTDMRELGRRAVAAAGRFESGVPDLSIEHDRYLGDAPAKDGVANGRPAQGGAKKDGGSR